MKLLIVGAATLFAAFILPLLAAASLVFPLLPFLIGGILLSAVLQRRRRAAGARALTGTPTCPMPPPQAAVGGWVYVPVWVTATPRPAPIVVEGQVVERRDG